MIKEANNTQKELHRIDHRANPKDPSEGKDDFWKSMASPISLVYFDSENLDLYGERLVRSEGAQLVRVRWYGKHKAKG